MQSVMNNAWLLLHLSPGEPRLAAEGPLFPVGGMGYLSSWLLVKLWEDAWGASGSWGHRPSEEVSSGPDMLCGSWVGVCLGLSLRVSHREQKDFPVWRALLSPPWAGAAPQSLCRDSHNDLTVPGTDQGQRVTPSQWPVWG